MIWRGQHWKRPCHWRATPKTTKATNKTKTTTSKTTKASTKQQKRRIQLCKRRRQGPTPLKLEKNDKNSMKKTEENCNADYRMFDNAKDENNDKYRNANHSNENIITMKMKINTAQQTTNTKRLQSSKLQQRFPSKKDKKSKAHCRASKMNSLNDRAWWGLTAGTDLICALLPRPMRVEESPWNMLRPGATEEALAYGRRCNRPKRLYSFVHLLSLYPKPLYQNCPQFQYGFADMRMVAGLRNHYRNNWDQAFQI